MARCRTNLTHGRRAAADRLTDRVDYDILFVRYEHLFDHVPEVLRFICERTGRLPELQCVRPPEPKP